MLNFFCAVLVGLFACCSPSHAIRHSVSHSTFTSTLIQTNIIESQKWRTLTDAELALVSLWGVDELYYNQNDVCWKDSYPNGVGKPMTCAPDQTKEGALCYSKCRTGYTATSGDLFCYKHCPDDFHDDGLYCRKPPAATRGVGKIRILGCNQNEEKYLGLCYKKCRSGFYPFGCCICSPSCPVGFKDIGVSCKKPVDTRDVDPLTTCPTGLVKDPTGLLCYSKCKSKYSMVGPVCWRDCPAAHPFKCGALCAASKDRCALATVDMILSPVMMVVNILSLGTSSPLSTLSNSLTKAGKLTPTLVKRIKQAYVIADGLNTVAFLADAQVGTISSALNAGIASVLHDRVVKAYGPANAVIAMKRISDAITVIMALQAFKELGLTIAATADPTGIVGVITAYAHPECRDETLPPTIPGIQL